MSTLSEREAALRRALQSAAASIEPAPDGLERIQARLRRPRPVAIAWLEAAWTDFFLRARAALQTAGPLLAHGIRRIWQRFGPDSVPDRGRALRWLRPLAALSLAIFVVAAGAYVGLNGSALFTVGTSKNSGSINSGPTNPVGSGRAKADGSGSPGPSSSQPHSSATTPACKKSHKPNGHFSEPSPSASTSSSPSSTSPSPSPDPTPTSSSPSPTPDTSTSSTPDPADTTAATGAGDGASGDASTASTGQTDAAGISAADNAITTAASTPSSRRHAKPSTTPCVSTTAALIRPAGLTPREGEEATTLAIAQLTAARLDTAVLAARLNQHFAV